MRKLAYSVSEVCRETTFGKTKIYELIAAGKLDARKIGRRTIITGESLERLIEGEAA
jgi:excisionase family DNA binding protein